MRRRLAGLVLLFAPFASPQDGPVSAAPPVVEPRPVEMRVLGEDRPLGSTLTLSGKISPALSSELSRLARDWNVTLSGDSPGAAGSSIAFALDVPGLEPQAYSIDIESKRGQPVISIRAGDEAGAYYALQSLSQLVRSRQGVPHVPSVAIQDRPAFPRRGWIFGYEPEAVLEEMELAARLKLNFVMLTVCRDEFETHRDWLRQWLDFAPAHHIELCALIGYLDFLEKTPIEEVLKYYDRRYDFGFRTFTVSFDDLALDSPEAGREAAERHVTVARRVAEHLWERDPSVRFIFCPVPYGGIPGKTDFVFRRVDLDAAVEYLKVVKEKLPERIPVFWTGHDVFSPKVSMAAAEAYREAVGRPMFFWDNDALNFANAGAPLSGRPAALHRLCAGYVGNLAEGECHWKGQREHVRRTLASIAEYAWNPESPVLSRNRQY